MPSEKPEEKNLVTGIKIKKGKILRKIDPGAVFSEAQDLRRVLQRVHKMKVKVTPFPAENEVRFSEPVPLEFLQGHFRQSNFTPEYHYLMPTPSQTTEQPHSRIGANHFDARQPVDITLESPKQETEIQEPKVYVSKEKDEEIERLAFRTLELEELLQNPSIEGFSKRIIESENKRLSSLSDRYGRIYKEVEDILTEIPSIAERHSRVEKLLRLHEKSTPEKYDRLKKKADEARIIVSSLMPIYENERLRSTMSKEQTEMLKEGQKVIEQLQELDLGATIKELIHVDDSVERLHYVLTNAIDEEGNYKVILNIPVKAKKEEEYTDLERGLIRHAIESLQSSSTKLQNNPTLIEKDGYVSFVLDLSTEKTHKTPGHIQEDIKSRLYDSQINYLFNRLGLRIDIDSFSTTDEISAPGVLEFLVEEDTATEKTLTRSRKTKKTSNFTEKLEQFYSRLPEKIQPAYRELGKKIDLEELFDKLKINGPISKYNMAVIKALSETKKPGISASEIINSAKDDLQQTKTWVSSSELSVYHTLKNLSRNRFINREGTVNHYTYSLNNKKIPLLESIAKQGKINKSRTLSKDFDAKLESIYELLPEYRQLGLNIDLKKILKETQQKYSRDLETIAVVAALNIISKELLTVKQIVDIVRNDIGKAGRAPKIKTLRKNILGVVNELHKKGYLYRTGTRQNDDVYQYSLTEKVYYRAKN